MKLLYHTTNYSLLLHIEILIYPYSGDTDSVDPSDVEGNVSRLLDGLKTNTLKKYSERNGIFGYEKLNRPDINAVRFRALG